MSYWTDPAWQQARHHADKVPQRQSRYHKWMDQQACIAALKAYLRKSTRGGK